MVAGMATPDRVVRQPHAKGDISQAWPRENWGDCSRRRERQVGRRYGGRVRNRSVPVQTSVSTRSCFSSSFRLLPRSPAAPAPRAHSPSAAGLRIQPLKWFCHRVPPHHRAGLLRTSSLVPLCSSPPSLLPGIVLQPALSRSCPALRPPMAPHYLLN